MKQITDRPGTHIGRLTEGLPANETRRATDDYNVGRTLTDVALVAVFAGAGCQAIIDTIRDPDTKKWHTEVFAHPPIEDPEAAKNLSEATARVFGTIATLFAMEHPGTEGVIATFTPID